MGNYKSFVFNSTSETESLVTPAIGRYHLYINTNGILSVIDHEGNIISQGSSGSSSVGTNDVTDQSDIGGANLTDSLNLIVEIINGITVPPSVASVNGQDGIVVLDGEDISLDDFVVLNINNDIVNGVYRKHPTNTPTTYYRVDSGFSGSSNYISIRTVVSVGNVWVIHENDSPTYAAATSGIATPADVTDWTVYNYITSVPYSSSVLYSGNSQTALEQLSQKVENNSMLVYDGTFINSHLEAIYVTTTSSGSWTVYPTDDASNTGDPIFSSILVAIPSITYASPASVSVNSVGVNSISGDAVIIPEGDAVANGTVITVLIKGIRA